MNLRRTKREPNFTKYLISNQTFKNDVLKVCDVGAREGYPDWLRYYNNQLFVTGFEADKSECERLNKIVPCQNTLPYALHKNKRKRTFYLTNQSASCSFYKPSKFISRIHNEDDLTIKGTIQLETSSLDSFKLNFDFMKLDAEGCELDILKGAKKTLKSVLGLTVETAFNPTHNNQPLFSNIDLFLRKQGFNLYDLITCVYTRKSLPAIDSKPYYGQVFIGQATYFRDIYDSIESYSENQILKLVSLMEIFALNDCALEILDKSNLQRQDIDALKALLIPDIGGRK